MIEVEQPEGISTRKLVLETARHNVITAYTGEAGAQLLRRFPNVDVAVVHTELDDSNFQETIAALRRVRKDLKVIGISPFSDRSHDGADYMLKSHNPQDLLRLLAEEFEAELSDTDAE